MVILPMQSTGGDYHRTYTMSPLVIRMTDPLVVHLREHGYRNKGALN